MKFISCDEQHDTFLLTQLETKLFGFFSEKFCGFCNATKETGKYTTSNCHIITAYINTEHVNVAPVFVLIFENCPVEFPAGEN